jgi:hypothetical protein
MHAVFGLLKKAQETRLRLLINYGTNCALTLPKVMLIAKSPS